MVISFDTIPEKLRLPFTAIEFSNRLAGNANIDFKMLVIGQRLSTGTIPAGQAVRANSPEELEAYFGRGSMLAEMGKAQINADQFTEKWFLALDDASGGAAATGSITVSGPATRGGTVFLYIAGYRLLIGVDAADTDEDIASAIVAAITAETTLPVTAEVNGAESTQVDITCKWKGETGNDIDMRLNFYDEALPDGVGLTFVAMSGGTGNPDLTDVFTAIGDEWYNWLAVPYTDTANLVVLEAEAESRWGPMRAIGFRAFTAFKGTHSETGTFGSGRNGPHVTCMGTNDSPTPPYLWAGVNCVVAAASLQIDPARQLRTLALPGIKPPKKELRWDGTERNQLLFDGIATYSVDRGGLVRIERQISMYQTNASGFADDSYLNINTAETLERIRFEQRAMVSQKFPRHKLADDDFDIPAGQAVVTPNAMEDEFLALYTVFMDRGWCQDYEGYKATIIAEIHDDDPDRLDMYDSPKLINNLRVTAVHTEYRR